jgi:hypothetical protein
MKNGDDDARFRLFSPRRDHGYQECHATRVLRVCEDASALGSFEDVPGVRRHSLLRHFTQSSRQQTRGYERAPGDRFGGTGGALAVLLSRWCVRGVLILSWIYVDCHIAPSRLSAITIESGAAPQR